MGLLKREDLLKKETLKIEKVQLDKDDYVFVRQMTGRERDQFEKSFFKEEKDENGNVNYQRSLDDFRAKLAVNTVCDEKGEMLFQSDDYEQLSKSISAQKLEKIVEVAQGLNKLSDKDKENLVKNSQGDMVADSSLG